MYSKDGLSGIRPQRSDSSYIDMVTLQPCCLTKRLWYPTQVCDIFAIATTQVIRDNCGYPDSNRCIKLCIVSLIDHKILPDLFPMERPTSTSTSAADYVDRIWRYSRHTAAGIAYRPLADFLVNGMSKARNIESADASSDCLTWYSGIYPSIPLSLNPALSLSQFRGLDKSSISSAANGRLIFLRGYPSAKWLALVGHLFSGWPRLLETSSGLLVSINRYLLPGTPSAFDERQPVPNASWIHRQLGTLLATKPSSHSDTTQNGCGWHGKVL